MTKYSVSSSDKGSLNFPTEEDYRAFEEDERLLYEKHRKILKEKYGVWARNQNKYVKDESEFNELDKW